MGKSWCLFLSLVWGVCGEQLPPLSANFNQNGILYTQISEEVVFGCEINRNHAVLAHNKVSIIRKSALEELEHIVSQTPGMLKKDSNYTVDVEPVPGNGILINISFKVRDLDEGTFICRVEVDGGNPVEDKLEVQINKPLRNIYLELNGGSPISETTIEPIEEFPGNHTVACIANGSNPAPSVYLFFNEKEVEHSDKQTVTLETKLRQYKTIINATIPIKFSTSNQEIKCNASTMLEDEHSVAIPIKTLIRDPEINCSDSEAYEGQPHPVLTCTIKLYKGFNITNYTYADGNHTVKFIDQSIKKLSDAEIEVTLKLDEAKDWHFRDFYLLLTHSDGHITRESVKLRKAAGAPNSSTFVHYLQETAFVAFAAWLFLYS